MTKSQKFYKMKGCSKKTRKHLGGSKTNFTNVTLSYPTKNIFSIPNPHLAYKGKGGNNGLTQINTKNLNPNQGPSGPFPGWLNPSMQRGGCGCGGNIPVQSGGKHRMGCKCSMCKNKKQMKKQKGGNGLPYGQGMPEMKGIPYPNGLTGQSWQPNLQWPGSNNISGDFNHYSLNKYEPVDISREMIATGAQPPFSIGGSNKNKGKTKNMNKSKKLRGGSNYLVQDLVNLGRQFTHGLGSAYNGLRGYSAPVNPLPWNGQLVNTPNLTELKSL